MREIKFRGKNSKDEWTASIWKMPYKNIVRHSTPTTNRKSLSLA